MRSLGFVFLLVLSLGTAGFTELLKKDKCVHPRDRNFLPEDIDELLIGGEWVYQYSFYRDSCYTEVGAAGLPRKMSFYTIVDSVQIDDSLLLRYRPGDLLQNVGATITDEKGNAYRTIPTSYRGYEDSTSLLDIKHHPTVGSMEIEDKYYFLVTGIVRDTMSIHSGRLVFGLDFSKSKDTRQVYIRQH